MGAGHAGAFPAMSGRRRNVHAAMAAMVAYETALARRLLDRFAEIRGLTVHGVTARDRLHRRVPTFSVTVEGRAPADLAAALAAENIFVWDGN
jgi:selenocysteine lyase/cysteine desulfurase